MYKFVFRLYSACFVRAEQILKRAENNDRLCFVASVKLFVKFFCVELCLFVAHKLPAFEINVVSQVFLPSGFNGRLKC